MNNNTTPSPSPYPAAKTSASPKPNASATAGTKRKRSAPGKIYAVKAGYQPGIYYKWNDCLTQVTGYKGAVCKCRKNYLPC
jgi:ribonuclease HI